MALTDAEWGVYVRARREPGASCFLKEAALNRMGLLDYFSAVFDEMLSYHAVGELFFGGGHIEATGLFKSIFLFAGFPLNV